MHLVLDIFQGLGVAAAVGIRPFLPALVVGALAAGDVQIDFQGTDFSFLQAWPFLLGMFAAAVATALLERRRANAQPAPMTGVLALAGLALGALLFAAALGQDHYATWPGLIGGAASAAVGILATRPLVARVRARLSGADAGALPAYIEVAALVFALLAVLAPPAGLVGLALLLWLLVAGRRRESQKYAGLRILR